VVIVRAPVDRLTDRDLMAHLLRRAGFGPTYQELEAALADGYETTVERLLHPEAEPPLDEELVFRYYVDAKEARVIDAAQTYWVYRMINSQRPLEEKLTLFWHCLFATAYSKVPNARVLRYQIQMFREHCLGSFRTMLAQLARDPAMIFWLDNQENTTDVHNENFGRELLELFSMGRGNYTEDDVKNCARAFTGWGLKPTIPGFQPYGRFDWAFQFNAEQHDHDEKVLLGERGPLDGDDAIDVIVRQPATARFIAQRLFAFFAADEPDEATISHLADVYLQSQYDIRAVLRSLFLSDFFRSEAAYYGKVKSPAEHVVGVMRLVGDYRYPTYGLREIAQECGYMGQDLLIPPSVEGWHTGQEWIDTGILVERVNFAAEQVSDIGKPGIRAMIERLRTAGPLSAADLVDACLDEIGPLTLNARVRDAIVAFAAQDGHTDLTVGDPKADALVGKLLQLIVSTREFQLC
jgi:uncharacterized protein (DUF1800 family)